MGRALLLPAFVAAWLALSPPVGAQQAPVRPAASAPSLPAQLPLLREGKEGNRSAGVGWRAATMLLLAGGVGGWLLWRRGLLLRAASPARAPRAAHSVLRLSSQALTPQASVHSVRWQGEDLLLGCTAQQVTVLARRPADAASREEDA